jgi:hypothetical protein
MVGYTGMPFWRRAGHWAPHVMLTFLEIASAKAEGGAVPKRLSHRHRPA